jgi:hypothetical protein
MATTDDLADWLGRLRLMRKRIVSAQRPGAAGAKFAVTTRG